MTSLAKENQYLQLTSSRVAIILEDWHTFSYYGIVNADIIYVSLQKYVLQIFVKGFDGGTKTLMLPKASECSVETLEHKYEEKLGIKLIPERLIYNGKTLRHGYMVNHYGVGQESTLHLVYHMTDACYDRKDVFVKFGEKHLTFEAIRLNQNVQELKRMIREREGIHEDEQILFSGSQRMFGDECISDWSTFDLTVRLSAELKLSLMFPCGKKVTISAQTCDTVAVIISEILEMDDFYSLFIPYQVRASASCCTVWQPNTAWLCCMHVSKWTKVFMPCCFSFGSEASGIHWYTCCLHVKL